MKIRESLPLNIRGEIDLTEWLTKLPITLPKSTRQVIETVVHWSCDTAQKENIVCTVILQKSLECAEILLSLKLDSASIAAAMLYPFVEAGIAIETLPLANTEVSKLLEGILHIEDTRKRGSLDTQGSSKDKLRRLLLAVINDVRVVLIKMVERLYTLSHREKLNEFQIEQVAIECREIYAPIANRLGVGQLKWELEDLAFRALEPVFYKQIAVLLDERRIDREKHVQDVVQKIKEALQAAHLEAEIVGRAKHIYSIWRKMTRKNLAFGDIYDVRAIRIVVPQIADCYAALGIVHALWQHIPKEFDDYIATPKANGYRSLHTAVVGPEGKALEIQIRTFEMHQQAELGVAAHWVYKEDHKQDVAYQERMNNLRQLLEWHDEIGGLASEEENLAAEVLEDRIYVFTPKGEVIDLPQRATPLDFAYQIHTDLGHRCRGAKVNRNIVSLNTPLKSGDQVEILAAKVGAPSRDWLNPHLGYLRSARARAKVSSWFKKLNAEETFKEGRILLEKELKRYDLGRPDLSKLATKLHFKNEHDLIMALGKGELRMASILEALDPSLKTAPAPILINEPTKKRTGSSSEILVQGIGNLMTHFAKCCKPIYGDSVVGYITLGRGVTIHRKDCLSAFQMVDAKEARLIQVEWGNSVRQVYATDLSIRAYDRQGLLRDITNILSQERVNVTAVKTKTNPVDNIADMSITLEIADVEMLERVISRVSQLENVLEVCRIKV